MIDWSAVGSGTKVVDGIKDYTVVGIIIDGPAIILEDEHGQRLTIGANGQTARDMRLADGSGVGEKG